MYVYMYYMRIFVYLCLCVYMCIYINTYSETMLLEETQV